MANPKLSYFDFPGSRGEECRLAFVLAGVEFDDYRIPSSDWGKLKHSTPFGALPVLEIEGKGKLSESNAILVYIGRNHNLHPSDPWEAAQHEQLLCASEQLRAKVMPALNIKDQSEMKKVREDLANGLLQDWGRGVESLLGEGPFISGSKVNVADIKLYMIVRWFASGNVDLIPKDVFKNFPKLNRVYNAVSDHPAVKNWYSR